MQNVFPKLLNILQVKSKDRSYEKFDSLAAMSNNGTWLPMDLSMHDGNQTAPLDLSLGTKKKVKTTTTSIMSNKSYPAMHSSFIPLLKYERPMTSFATSMTSPTPQISLSPMTSRYPNLLQQAFWAAAAQGSHLSRFWNNLRARMPKPLDSQGQYLLP